MAHEMNLNDVRRWQAADIERWNHSRGRITQRVRGSHVDIYVRLYRWARIGFAALICVLIPLVGFVVANILASILSGRVHEILVNAVKAGQ